MKRIDGTDITISDKSVRVVICVTCKAKITEMDKESRFGRIRTNSGIRTHEEFSPLGVGCHDYATFDVPGNRGMPGVVVTGELSFCVTPNGKGQRQTRGN